VDDLFAYMTPDLIDPLHKLPNGTSPRPDLVKCTRTPDILFEAHSAPLDMQFYTGEQFSARYRNGAFAALHGTYVVGQNRGYNIASIPFDSATHRPIGYYEPFVDGFLIQPNGSDTFGRPVGLLVLKDGSLIFTEDGNHRIYQVQYKNSAHRYNLASVTFLTACKLFLTF
jgi:glucose/arabinose dehydrogenase